MKSERRHELQQNALAAWVNQHGDSVKPYLSWIAGGIIVGVLIALIVSFQRRESAASAAAGWDQYLMAQNMGNLDEMKRLADEGGASSLGVIARLTAADLLMEQGARDAGVNRDTAKKKFEEAVNLYKKASLDAGSEEMLKNRAEFGLGKAYEWLMQYDNAQKAYAQVTGPLAALAAQRSADLDRASTREFYTLYAAHTPTPAAADPFGISDDFDLSSPGPTGVGSEFDLLNPLPGETSQSDDRDALVPDNLFPLPSGLTPSADVPAADAAPATEDAPATETAPSDEAPAATDSESPEETAADADADEAPADAEPAGESAQE